MQDLSRVYMQVWFLKSLSYQVRTGVYNQPNENADSSQQSPMSK